jgi:hypothetical protein
MEQDARALRKKVKSWLAILAHSCVQGWNQSGVLSNNLHPLYKSLVIPEILQETFNNAAAKTPDEKETIDIKRRIKSRLTLNKIKRKILGFPKILDKKTKPFSLTPLRLVITWAVFTNQPVKDLIVRVFPSINRLFAHFLTMTTEEGCWCQKCR